MMNLFNTLLARAIPVVPRPLVGRVSRRYIAGESLDDATRVVRELNARGIMATIDVLGESITNLAEAERNVELYLATLDRIRSEKLDSNVSVKLSSLGLLVDAEHCYQNVRRLAVRASEFGNFVRIDMEDSACTDLTLEVYNRLRQEFERVGIVLQAYLRRTIADATRLGEHRANVRLCKGIYVESRRIAYKDRGVIQRNFADAIRLLLTRGSYVGIATHDEVVVWEAERIIRELGLTRDQYEFQMLLGVDEQLRDLLVRDGHRMRIYVPYGREWYAYSLRRLKENPAIAGHILKATLGLGPSRNGSH